MKIVKSVQNLYEENLPYFEIIRKKVDTIILNNKNNRWHYESRIKQLESFAMKFETGRFSKTEVFEDLFAATIVVKNLEEIRLAEDLIVNNFDLKNKKPFSTDMTHKESFSFPFDDLRLYVAIKDFQTGELAPDIFNFTFEIQIKSFLQHAWSIATHDLIYKSDKINWAKERVAYQVKAALEHAELTISGVEELSKLSEIAKENKEVKKVNDMISLILNHWKDEDLPKDKRRLAQNIITFIDTVQLTIEELDAILTAETSIGKGILTRDLSPYLITVQSVLNSNPDKVKKYIQSTKSWNKHKILFTTEMQLPNFGNYNNEKVIFI